MTDKGVSTVSLLLLAGLAAQPLRAEADRFTDHFAVQLYNHADAPAELITRAAQVAAEIFERAELEMDWVLCPNPADAAGDGPSCLDLGKSVLRINVLDREKAARLGVTPGAFGLAFPAESGYGVVATVFHHRVAELERDTSLDGALILGHILAHEIGHLLLGFRSHTDEGIMTAHWDEVQTLRIEQGAFGFYDGQARKMRRQVRRRHAEDARNEASSVADSNG